MMPERFSKYDPKQYATVVGLLKKEFSAGPGIGGRPKTFLQRLARVKENARVAGVNISDGHLRFLTRKLSMGRGRILDESKFGKSKRGHGGIRVAKTPEQITRDAEMAISALKANGFRFENAARALGRSVGATRYALRDDGPSPRGLMLAELLKHTNEGRPSKIAPAMKRSVASIQLNLRLAKAAKELALLASVRHDHTITAEEIVRDWKKTTKFVNAFAVAKHDTPERLRIVRDFVEWDKGGRDMDAKIPLINGRPAALRTKNNGASASRKGNGK